LAVVPASVVLLAEEQALAARLELVLEALLAVALVLVALSAAVLVLV
jgi:hypothetical protein